MIPHPRLYAWLPLASIAALNRTATLAGAVRPQSDRTFGANQRIGAASIAAQCLNTLRGDVCDGTLAPEDVRWQDVEPQLPARMLHMTDPVGDLVVLAERLGVDLSGSDGRRFVNAIMGFAVDRYLPEIRAALRMSTADVRRLESASLVA